MYKTRLSSWKRNVLRLPVGPAPCLLPFVTAQELSLTVVCGSVPLRCCGIDGTDPPHRTNVCFCRRAMLPSGQTAPLRAVCTRNRRTLAACWARRRRRSCS